MSQSDSESIDADPAGLGVLARRASKSFFLPSNLEAALSPFVENVVQVPAPYDEIARAFVSNVEGLMSTVEIPYSLANASSMDRHYQRLSTAARIRARGLQPAPDETDEDLRRRQDEEATVAARRQMNEMLHSPDGINKVAADTCSFLLRGLDDLAFADAARELLLQGSVLCWAAFEVVARDAFVATLNHAPALSQRLLADPVAKRRFDLSKIPFETIASHGFDLSQRMGTLLAEQQDLSDLRSIRAVYEALFPEDGDLAKALSDPDLRLLAERRHLIVHRRGAIDATFIQKTGASNPIGTRLAVSPDDLERHIKTCINAATSLLRCVVVGAQASFDPTAAWAPGVKS